MLLNDVVMGKTIKLTVGDDSLIVVRTRLHSRLYPLSLVLHLPWSVCVASGWLWFRCWRTRKRSQLRWEHWCIFFLTAALKSLLLIRYLVQFTGWDFFWFNTETMSDPNYPCGYLRMTRFAQLTWSSSRNRIRQRTSSSQHLCPPLPWPFAITKRLTCYESSELVFVKQHFKDMNMAVL